MPVTQARALFDASGLRIEPHDPAGDHAALRRLAVWAHRLAPVVAVDEARDPPDGLMLDVTGCARVWRGEDRIACTALDRLGRLGIAARVAVAPTFGAAWALARFGDDRMCVVGAAEHRAALAALPVEALRLEPGVVDQLAEVGVRRVGEVMDLPRAALPARFGDGLLLRLDQAMGHAIETIEPVRPVPPPAATREFEGPTDRIEAVEMAVRELLDDLGVALERRGCGVRRLEVALDRSDLGPEVCAVVLGRPSRDAAHLWRLVRPKLERAHLGFGVEGVRVRAVAIARIRHEQAEHAGLQPVSGEALCASATAAEIERACDEMIDTIENGLGDAGRAERVVCRAELRESHLPERAVVMRWACEGSEGATQAALAPGDRPTVLLDPPVPAEVMALTPDGPVHRVSWQGEDAVVTACVGPERIAGEWWRAIGTRQGRTRDYFAVRLEGGAWLWLGRGIESGRWFVHGVWA